ncbi:hypothetical protein FB45DRAFT_1124841 [Roridomyces roridus]|uniref:MYND-type domain-containing protein n=1 Tax=Roridomyces roridus TaxID=1738132 RepID=A0AAD7FSW9_9AGAR|nr:hypothetical protein FB45DRAFT_1124841 [Roridomyces roridus]
MPRLVLKPAIISAEGVSDGELNLDPETLLSRLAVRMCDRRDFNNHDGKLDKCSRCKTAMYCSKDYQRHDWPLHKPACQLASTFAPDPVTGEPALKRYLRLWTSRFNGSLVCATIVALKLNAHPSNIDNFGLIINLRPRPHTDSGARFELISVVKPMLEIQFMMTIAEGITTSKLNGESRLLEMHAQHRTAVKRSSHGQEDYATVLVVAHNDGPYAIPGAVEKEIRFKPIGAHKRMVRSPVLTDPNLDWYTTFRYQVQENLPNQTIVDSST